MAGVVLDPGRGPWPDGPARVGSLLAQRRPGVRRTWVGEAGAPWAEEVVPRGSARHLTRLAGARVVVAAGLVARAGLPRHGTAVVQTWHGTPVKLLGFDERSRAYDAAGSELAALRRDVGHWDHLVTAGPAATEVLRSAFRYDGPVLEVGSPRNDALLAPDAPAVRERVRRSLGAADRPVVLYAPTWRDDGRSVWHHPELALLLAGLPHDTLMAVRRHPRDAAAPAHPRVVDVTGYDLPALFLAADVLVSDYSSVVADFALTRKPVVLFAPDLAEYAVLRGFYDAYESWAAWPVARTASETIELLEQPPLDKAAHQRFLDTWCPYDDGHAGERVVDLLVELLGGTSSQG